MSDSGKEEAERGADPEREEFEARFPPDAFEPVVKALGFRPTSENLEALKGWLMPHLDQSYSGSVVKRPSRKDGITKLAKLRDALALVGDASLSRSGTAALPWTVGDLIDGADEKFAATVRRLQQGVEKRLQDLQGTPGRRGPKPKSAFRDFAPDLIWIYEGMTGSEAKKPHWLPDSGTYGGEFYRFAGAVWKCVRTYLPEHKDILPTSEGALAQELQEHWPKQDTKTG